MALALEGRDRARLGVVQLPVAAGNLGEEHPDGNDRGVVVTPLVEVLLVPLTDVDRLADVPGPVRELVGVYPAAAAVRQVARDRPAAV